MKSIYVAFLISIVFLGCSKNAVTGRKQLSLVSEPELQSLALQEYKTFLNENQVLHNNNADMVKRVGSKISSAIKQYYDSKGKTEILNGYNWEFNLIENKEANAWCMPGGKVVVYSGLLPITQNEAGLAIVIGHEITHAVAQHGAERMSQGLLQQLGGSVLSIALANKPQETQNLFLNAYGIGTTIGAILPFSRKEESEADEYGLYYAAMGGYNPNEAITFWERMASAAGSQPIEFLSDHPSDANRISQMKKYLPKAIKYYQASKN
ncbi:MAG: M48 family metallopeptidase [Saprospiraceae bacterium]|nr:M48 family metallopeptidase [Saprospiraceae bacterium]MBK8776266.1 M48 family metallopeptidase [Saprospiraceae bacterium]MBK9678510.1 M48 family metallopeptidase [Saprospiraceae bacterium]